MTAKNWKARDEPEKAHHGRNRKKKHQKRSTTMAYRKKTKPTKDRRMFNVTARKTKAINLSSKPMRGGIRL